MYWWTTLVRERRLHNDPPIELIDKLQRLEQKNMSVEEYRQKMELYLMRAGIKEEEKLTIARFLSGLNFDIRDRVELLPYICGKTSDIKCFKCLGRGHIASQCPNKKVMILRGQDSYSSHDETSSSTSSDSDSSDDDHQVENAYPYDGQLLMIRRLLGSQPNESHISQRENIFHTRCKILDNACSLIVDSGSCCNFCSTRLVEKLNLTPIPHPKPYQLHWLNEDGDIIVDKQVKVKFSIGNYEDQVVCDIVPMEACNILLGNMAI
uniref:CCHC-type domain-containing protein n=1 Tax=Cajanus cajan TaxID=3821 RepID=A0A151SFD3_CAJCA|nr:hypothetical protein KK1_024432 [Cajanus cajan]